MPENLIETPRLTLREFCLGDLDFYAEMRAHPEVMRFWPKPDSRNEARAMLKKQMGNYARDCHGLWRVGLREDDTPIGAVGLVTQVEEGETFHEIGYMIHRPYWRRGYAHEAAAAVRDWAFKNREYDPVVSFIRPENTPSQAVARKMGMTPQDRLIDHAGLPHHVFEITRARWQELR